MNNKTHHAGVGVKRLGKRDQAWHGG